MKIEADVGVLRQAGLELLVTVKEDPPLHAEAVAEQRTFVPEAEVQQVFGRFRASVAKDFRIQEQGAPGFFTHVSAGIGLDVGYERWHFSGLGEDTTTS